FAARKTNSARSRYFVRNRTLTRHAAQRDHDLAVVRSTTQTVAAKTCRVKRREVELVGAHALLIARRAGERGEMSTISACFHVPQPSTNRDGELHKEARIKRSAAGAGA